VYSAGTPSYPLFAGYLPGPEFAESVQQSPEITLIMLKLKIKMGFSRLFKIQVFFETIKPVSLKSIG